MNDPLTFAPLIFHAVTASAIGSVFSEINPAVGAIITAVLSFMIAPVVNRFVQREKMHTDVYATREVTAVTGLQGLVDQLQEEVSRRLSESASQDTEISRLREELRSTRAAFDKELGGVREELRHVRGNRDRLLADLEARRCPVHKGGLCVIPIQLDKPAPAPEND